MPFPDCFKVSVCACFSTNVCLSWSLKNVSLGSLNFSAVVQRQKNHFVCCLPKAIQSGDLNQKRIYNVVSQFIDGWSVFLSLMSIVCLLENWQLSVDFLKTAENPTGSICTTNANSYQQMGKHRFKGFILQKACQNFFELPRIGMLNQPLHGNAHKPWNSLLIAGKIPQDKCVFPQQICIFQKWKISTVSCFKQSLGQIPSLGMSYFSCTRQFLAKLKSQTQLLA